MGSRVGVCTCAVCRFSEGVEVVNEVLEVLVVVFYFVAELMFDRLGKGGNEVYRSTGEDWLVRWVSILRTT